MRLALEVFINDQPTGLIGDIYRLPDGRLMARREELIALGIVPLGKGPAREMVAFDAIPGISVFYQEREQKLQLQLPDSRRIPREYDLHAGRLRKEILPETAREFGLVTNYSAYGTFARGYGTGARPYSTGTLTLESRAISPYGTLQNSAILGTTLGREGALRLETAYVYTHRETATRVVAGDTISAGPAWSRPVRFGGVQIGRDFGLRPDIVTAPMPSVSGSAAVPSTVDVYVDTMRIASQPVGAGPFRLTNLPVSGESGTARVVVRDVTGRETATSLPFFTSARLLAPGMSDYSVEFGYPRLRYALDSFDYGERPMGQGSFRYGLSDRMTLEAHAETTARLVLAGGGLTLGAGRLGTFSIAGAASRHAGAFGALGHASWQANWRPLFLGASTQRRFGPYQDLAGATAPLALRGLPVPLTASGFYAPLRSARVPRAIDRASLGARFEALDASASVNLVNVERVGGDTTRLASLSWSQTLARKYNAHVTLFSNFGTTRERGVLAGLYFPLDDGILVNTSAGATGGSRSAALDVNRPFGTGERDYSWRLYDSEGRLAMRGADLGYRTAQGRIGAGVRQDGTLLGGHGEAEGAIIATPAGIFASRRVQDAFAIVDAGAPGVEILHENRPVGRTGTSGKLVIPDVNSLQPSRIAVVPESLPPQSYAAQTETEILPSFRGVATVRFGTIAAREGARITIHDGHGKPMPPGTRFFFEEGKADFTIVYGGLTFLPRIAETNTLRIEDGDKSCTMTFSHADRRGTLGEVGPLTCAMH